LAAAILLVFTGDLLGKKLIWLLLFLLVFTFESVLIQTMERVLSCTTSSSAKSKGHTITLLISPTRLIGCTCVVMVIGLLASTCLPQKNELLSQAARRDSAASPRPRVAALGRPWRSDDAL
jgi:hypothetical protein